MFFESVAYAQGAAAPANTGMEGLASLIPFVLIFVVFYFLLIRPQSKKQKEHALMINALKAGDTVCTNSGIIGTITHVNNNVLELDLGSTKVKIFKMYVASKIDPVTFEDVAASSSQNNAQAVQEQAPEKENK